MSESDFNDTVASDPEEEHVTAFGLTDVGRVRDTNQDQFLIAHMNKTMRISSTSLALERRLYGNLQGEVLLVADGMGGHAAGEKASRLAIDYLVRRLLDSVHCFFHQEEDEEKEQEFINELKESMQDVHSRILLESAQNVDQRGMGTTLTMAHLVWPRMYVAHAGDSRCYLVRNGVADQLTTDHTLARQMVESGGLKPEEEADSKWSNVLWNVMGGKASGDLVTEVRRCDLRPGDSVVLCSDGLHRYVDEAAIADVVDRAESAEEACKKLVAMANAGGGEDNITAIVSQPETGDALKSTWIDGFETLIP